MTIKNNKICVEYERPFKPYPELTKANRVLLNNAAKKQNGWYHECLGSILLSAFRFEGLLNQFATSIAAANLSLINWVIKQYLFGMKLREFPGVKSLISYANISAFQ